MWTRKELKARGKAAFKRNYWNSVVAGAVVLMLFGAFAGGGSRASGSTKEITEAISQSGVSLTVFFGIPGIGILLATVISVFLYNPLEVGTNRFFLKNAQERASFKELFFAFQNGSFLKIVAAKFLEGLFIGLWSLLLVIPGIIKALEYMMVDYILADNPGIAPMDALRESKRMMKGHKWNAFVLGLSFLGWEILSVLTLGLLDLFYVRPYIEATYAELYLALKQ